MISSVGSVVWKMAKEVRKMLRCWISSRWKRVLGLQSKDKMNLNIQKCDYNWKDNLNKQYHLLNRADTTKETFGWDEEFDTSNDSKDGIQNVNLQHVLRSTRRQSDPYDFCQCLYSQCRFDDIRRPDRMVRGSAG